jgi:hypothetical protein
MFFFRFNFLQSYLALNEGCTIATELWYDLQATQTYTSTQGACLPIQREYVKLKLDHAELSAHIYEVHLAETKALNLKNLNKDHIIKVIVQFPWLLHWKLNIPTTNFVLV